MKRFSKVVRHPHKLTRWSAGIKLMAVKQKRKAKKRVMFCDEQRVSHENMIDARGDGVDIQSFCASWYSLRDGDMSAATLRDILEVLLNTCVNPCECYTDRLLIAGDIRSYLCDKKLTCQILLDLSVYWEEVIKSMEISSDKRRLLLEFNPYNLGEVGVELLRLFGWTSELGADEISGYHLSGLMPWLDGFDFLESRVMCDDWERLHSGLAGKVLFAFSNSRSLRSWLDSLLALDVNDGNSLLLTLIDKGVSHGVVEDNVAAIISYLFYESRVIGGEERVSRFVTLLLRGMSAARIRCLLEIEWEIGLKSGDAYCSIEGLDDFSAVEPLLVFMKGDEATLLWQGRFDSSLWGYVYSCILYYELDEERSRRFITLMRKQCYYMDSDVKSLEWYADKSAEAFSLVDADFYDKLGDLLYFQYGSEECSEGCEVRMRLVMTACSSKMEPKSDVDELLNRIQDESLGKVFLDELGQHGWQHLDRYFRSQNRGEILLEGLNKIIRFDRGFIMTVIRGLNAAPSDTLKAVREVGLLPGHLLKDVFQWVEYHPLYGIDSGDKKQRCAMMEYHSSEYGSVELPTKLMASIREGKMGENLREEVLLKEQRKLEVGEMRMLFSMIRERVVDEMSSFETDAHTVSIVSSASHNRRAGKRALERHQRGGDVTRLLHPSNISWLKRPLSFWRPAVWLMGITVREQLPSIGEVCVQTESRFDEILKMGTYVHSCLSIGGCNQHSAIANALDVNKRVLYMHDEEGKFIARQLLAITKERKLACFMVYHADHGYGKELIQACFARVNQQFSDQLGLSIQDQHEYEIETVVTRDWYDDGIWVPEKHNETEAKKQGRM